MRIQTIDTFPGELDGLARSSPAGTFYHTKVWIDSLAATYPRLSLRCIVAEVGGQPVGYLPFFFIKKGPLLTAWSMPFGTYGGPVALTDDVEKALLAEYARLAQRHDVVEVGWIDFDRRDAGSDWTQETRESHVVDLSAGFESFWATQIDKQRKKRHRQAERHGVTIRRMGSTEDLDRYYVIYADRIRRWGRRDQYPQQLFHELISRGDGDTVRLYLAFCGDDFLGGHFNFYFKNMVIAWNGVTSVASNHLQPATLLYTYCIKEACEDGFTSFNLGASLGKRSLVEFKESLGGTSKEYFQYRRRSLLGKIAAGVKRIGG